MRHDLENWKSCTKCGLHTTRRKVVIGEGPFPADILFVGEGPCKSEDLVGRPFCGIAGRLLREAVKDALESIGRIDDAPTYYISNLVACHPTDKRRGKNREPLGDEIAACWPRLVEIERAVRPQFFVCLGDIAHTQVKHYYPHAIKLYHPSYIRRRGGFQSTEYRAFLRRLMDIFEAVPRRKVNMQRRRRRNG